MKPRRFATRQYAYRPHHRPVSAVSTATPSASLLPGNIYQFVRGRSLAPVVLAPAELITRAHDPFATLVLGRGHLPQTLREILAIVDALPDSDAFPGRKSFVVADGGQIAWSQATADVDRSIRFAITRSRAGATPDLLVSTSDEFDSHDTFLQVIGWDAVVSAFQFYERRSGSWIWAGSSWDALEADTRGNGPFDSHVNGALNMKELKLPWINWHSVEASIADTILPPGSPLVSEPLWTQKSGGENFEGVVRAGVRRWTEARLAARTQNGRLTRLPEFMRQVLTTTTINLRTSAVASSRLAPGSPVPVPLSFFINADALIDGLQIGQATASPLSLDGGLYQRALDRFEVAVTDGAVRFAGDTHFAFLFPEASFEDVLIAERLRALGVLSDALAASLLMVDFCNPVFSRRRAALLQYVPADASLGPGSDFAARFLAAVRAAAPATPPSSPERELLANADLPAASWKATFESRIAAFLGAVATMMTDDAKFDGIFRLLESRRREFRKRPLAEFRLTTPVTNIPEDAPLLEFAPNGSIQAKET